MSPEELEAVLSNEVWLEQILKYHIVHGLLDAANFPTFPTVLTFEGRYLNTSDAGVTETDLGFSNGIVHVINQVIVVPENITKSTRYSLTERNNTGVFGTVLLKGNDSQTTISVLLSGTVIGEQHPVKIHAGNCSSGGEILVDLYDVAGTNGISRSTVNLAFDSLVGTDAYINVQISAENPNYDIACGELGLSIGGE